MQLKKSLMVLTFALLTLFLGSTTLAQQTWYVDNQIGNDGRNGLSPTIPDPDDFVTGPKKTLGGAQGAIAESNAGDIIVVNNTGVAYGLATGEPATITVTKVLTFQSSNGTPNINSTFEVNNANAAPNNVVIFNAGEFLLSGGLTLTQGVLTNAGQLITVSGIVTRSIAAAQVSGQLKYTGTVDFSYGATMTTADEFPSTGSFRHLTTTAGNLTLKGGVNPTMTGVLTTAGNLDLGSNVVTITSAGSPTHTIGGNVTNGTLAFSMGGAAASTVTVNGAFTLPTVTVTTSNDNSQTLAIAQPTGITGSIAISGQANVTTNAAFVTLGTTGYSGDVLVLSGEGVFTLSSGAAATIHGNVVLNSSGLNGANEGQIEFANTNTLTINGNVTNSAGISVGDNNTLNGGQAGRIRFADQTTIINGSVVNSVDLSGTLGTSTEATSNGLIVFLNTASNVTITGTINNSSKTSSSYTGALGAAGYADNGDIDLSAITTGIVRADGGISNSSNFSGITNAGATSNGDIVIGAVGTRTGISTVGTAGNRVGPINSSSVSNAHGDDGNIIIAGDGTTGGFFGTSVSSTGGSAGGAINFANENFNISGSISNGRTTSGGVAAISVGAAGLAGATVTIGGTVNNQSNTNINFNVSLDGAVAVTGAVMSSGSGTISFPNITTGTITWGGLTLSAGKVDIPATHNASLAINGTVNISGGTAELEADGGDAFTITGTASFTGGTVDATGRTSILLNCTSTTFGGASSNTTFADATVPMVIGNPTPTSLATFNIGTFNPTYPGNFQVNNTTGLAEAVRFTGSTMTISGTLNFASGAVSIQGLANITVVGAFTNTSGYTTSDQARITLQGTVAQNFGGTGSFGTIEFKNAAGMTTTTPVTLTGTIYLTAGQVSDGGGAISISNATVFPTIVRNNGTFQNIPTFVSKVNVTYIGDDKASGNELPAAADKLQNLTVATTTGAGGTNNVPATGVVTVGTNTTVNGNIIVNSGQTLLIDAVNLTMAGPAITLNGDIANEGAGILTLAATTGTTITGSGFLPPFQVGAGSTGNVVAGARAVVHQLVGTDNERGGGDDFNATTTAASGDISFGAGTASITVTFGTGALNGTHFNNLTTANANNTFTLGANATGAGNLTHAAGTVDVGTFTLTFLGTTHAYTAGANTVGDGMLQFTTTALTTLTVNANTATIATNVGIDAGAANFQLANGGQDLVITGNLSLNDAGGGATGGNFDIGAGRTLTAAGSNVSMSAGTNFIATLGGTTGVLMLDIAAVDETQTFTASAGAVTITNLTINDNVDLSFTGAAPTLTVNGTYLHSGGNVGLGTHTLTVAGTGTFRRTAGTYTASSGYLVVNTTTFNQGATDFTVPNLNIGANIAATLAGQTGVLTVTNALVLLQPGTADISSANTGGNTILAIDEGVTLTHSGVTATRFDVTPTFNGAITFIANPAAGATVVCHATIWPATPADLVSTFIMNGGNAAANFELPGDRNVGDVLDIRQGNLDLGTAANRTMTVTNSTVRRRGGAVVLAGGSLVFTNPPDVIYEPLSGAAFNTGPELPAIVNSLTFTRSNNSANSIVTVNSPVTVNNALIFRNNVNTGATATITALGDVTIAVDNYTAATAPVFVFGAPLNFGGDAMQTINVPGGGAVLGAITINKTNNTDKVTITGGNLTTGVITFVRGLLVTGNTTLFIPHPLLGGGQGFVRAVADGAISHVVGNVAKGPLVNSSNIATSSEPRIEFPVGSENVYRPVSITFNPNFGVPTVPAGVTLVVSHIDQSPTGTVGLPIINGVQQGVNVARYPGFYWNISTLPTSIGSVVFDLELGAAAFADFDDINNVRIIRRHGTITDVTNQWLLQGLANNYDNEVNNGVPTIINRNSDGGLRVGGAVFTLGLRSRLSVANPIDNQTLTAGGAAAVINLENPRVFAGNIGDLVYTAQSSNTNVATVAVDGTSLTVTPVAEGNAIISVTGTDTNNDFLTTTFNVNVAPLSNFTVSGTVTYDNTAATPLAGVTVKLYVNGDMNSTPVTATTDAAGAYSITDLPNGNHVVTATSSAAWGGVNSTDALLVSQHYAGIATLTGLKLSAGDVNNSNTVNNTDALKIVRRFAGLETSFTKPDWLFETKTVTVTGADVTADFKGIATGDANGSFVPAGALPKANIDLRSEDVLQVSPKDEFELPIKAVSDMNIGAVSLQFNYPADQVQLVEVKGMEGLVYNDVEGNVKVAWAALNGKAMNVKADNAVLVLKFKPTEKFVAGNTFSLELVGENEISAFNGNVIEKAGLSAASVESFVPKAFALEQNYPNPFNPSTVIEYALPENAKVTLTIYNVLGQEVARVLDQEQEAGVYKVNWNASGLASGVYIYNIKVETASKNYTDSKRMMLLK